MSIETTYLRSRILDAKSNLNEIREGLTFGDPTYIGVVAAIEILTDALAKAPPELKGARECWVFWTPEGLTVQEPRVLSFAPGPLLNPKQGHEWVHMREVQPTEPPTDQTDYKALYEEMLSNYVELAKIRKAEQGAKPGSGATPVSLVSPAPPPLTYTRVEVREGYPEAGKRGVVFSQPQAGEAMATVLMDGEAAPDLWAWRVLKILGPDTRKPAQPIPPEAGTI